MTEETARDYGFPAHAGMDLLPVDTGFDRARLPRTRGDGPRPAPAPRVPLRASPHTRGWTRRADVGPLGDEGFPAHAGMDPGGRR